MLASALTSTVVLAAVSSRPPASVSVHENNRTLREYGDIVRGLLHTPRETVQHIREDPVLRAQTSAVLGLLVGLLIVPRDTGPDYNSFRTAEAWRARLLSIRPIPFHQRLLMSLPFAAAAALAVSHPRARMHDAWTACSTTCVRLVSRVYCRTMPPVRAGCQRVLGHLSETSAWARCESQCATLRTQACVGYGRVRTAALASWENCPWKPRADAAWEARPWKGMRPAGDEGDAPQPTRRERLAMALTRRFTTGPHAARSRGAVGHMPLGKQRSTFQAQGAGEQDWLPAAASRAPRTRAP